MGTETPLHTLTQKGWAVYPEVCVRGKQAVMGLLVSEHSEQCRTGIACTLDSVEVFI